MTLKILFIELIVYCILFLVFLNKGFMRTVGYAIVYFGISLVAALALDIVLSIPFSYGILIALVIVFIMEISATKQHKAFMEEPIQETLKFLDDLSHFLSGYHRYAYIYYSNYEHGIIADVIVFDGKVEKDVYDSVCDTVSGEAFQTWSKEHYFGTYQNQTPHCYRLLISGTTERDDISLRFTLARVQGYLPELSHFLWQEVKEKFPSTEKKGDAISIHFH